MFDTGQASSTHACIAFEMIPIIRPNVAPMAIDGTKIPAGTLHPYEMMTSPIRTTVARRRVLTFRH